MTGAGRGGPGDARPAGADPARVAAALEVLGVLARPNAPLGALTTYRVGGLSALRVDASSGEDLAAVSRAVAASGLPVLVVGRGSNLLVSDAGFPGIAVTLDPGSAEFSSVEMASTDDGAFAVRAGAAVPLPALARRTAEAGLTGLEWAVGVPGSVGGAVRMNAGGHGSDVAACLGRAWIADLSGGEAASAVGRDALCYGYRRSSVGPADVVVRAEFVLRPAERRQALATIRDIVRWRRDHQPGGQNAGSVFTNPGGDPPANSAGWLIDAAGLKGRRWGSAMVSHKHANFIQADAGGSADDVHALLRQVQRVVLEKTSVALETEVELIGFPEPSTCSRGLS
ncbi:MAG: UDP-N-acetylmuramate dehydrogenase [Acidimicrobiales bacterium]